MDSLPPSTRFNPCCIGLAIAAKSEELATKFRAMFQSLLYWISHCGMVMWMWNLAWSVVSILVVLDQPLRHHHAMNRVCFGKSFNPCCIGLAIAATGKVWDSVPSLYGFNPCCIGLAIAASQSGDACRSHHQVSILVVLDQPLRPAIAAEDAIRYCFNPCCIGLAIAARLGVCRCHRHTAVSILVVLDQPLRPATDSMQGSLTMRCFNPCCIGLAIAAFCLLLPRAEVAGFNPCCIGLAIAAERRSNGADAVWCFNPCCIGLAIAAIQFGSVMDGLKTVSILVVLDQPLRLGARRYVDRCVLIVSILVVLDQPLRLFILSYALMRVDGFNPCCIGLAIAAREHNVLHIP